MLSGYCGIQYCACAAARSMSINDVANDGKGKISATDCVEDWVEIEGNIYYIVTINITFKHEYFVHKLPSLYQFFFFQDLLVVEPQTQRCIIAIAEVYLQQLMMQQPAVV